MSPFDEWRATAAFARLRPELLRYVTRLVGDYDQAEDVVQETLLRLRERPPADRSRIRGWLFTVATNVARDGARAARRHATLAAGAGARLPVADPPPDPSEVLEQTEVRERVRAALSQLSEKERVALLMREEGFRHHEIAEAVGTTTRSVGTLLARALDKMARRLEKDGGP